MRGLYIFLKITVSYALFFFFRRRRFVNEPSKRFSRTIYVSNHSASFMDPISLGAFTRPVVFFMTRSDVFTPLTQPLLWGCHMLPIYRQRDGVDTKGKNQESFRKSSKVLEKGKNLLIFGEGETYDVYVRRHKPLKKGAIRMGFIALESMNWKKEVHLAAVGISYSDPSLIRSDYLVSYSDSFCLNDYRSDYESNPNKTITDLTKKVELLLEKQVVHVENAELCDLHENVQMLTRKGIHPTCYDSKVDLKERWTYARKLAIELNNFEDEDPRLGDLKNKLESYRAELKTKKLSENDIYNYGQQNSAARSLNALFKLVLLFPIMVLGLIHCFIPFILVKRFVEQKFKRRVFWSSVKVVLGMIFIGIYNIPLIFLFVSYVYPSYWLALLNYLLVPFYGLAALLWFEALRQLSNARKVKRGKWDDLLAKRNNLLNQIQELFTTSRA